MLHLFFMDFEEISTAGSSLSVTFYILPWLEDVSSFLKQIDYVHDIYMLTLLCTLAEWLSIWKRQVEKTNNKTTLTSPRYSAWWVIAFFLFVLTCRTLKASNNSHSARWPRVTHFNLSSIHDTTAYSSLMKNFVQIRRWKRIGYILRKKPDWLTSGLP